MQPHFFQAGTGTNHLIDHSNKRHFAELLLNKAIAIASIETNVIERARKKLIEEQGIFPVVGFK